MPSKMIFTFLGTGAPEPKSLPVLNNLGSGKGQTFHSLSNSSCYFPIPSIIYLFSTATYELKITVNTPLNVLHL